jgi:hypothetical protein
LRARAGPYTTSHPEYYVRAPRGTPPPYDPTQYLPSGIAYGSSGWGPWMDTAQFNYWKRVARACACAARHRLTARSPDLVKVRTAELLKGASRGPSVRRA